jgi:hypothetical protein
MEGNEMWKSGKQENPAEDPVPEFLISTFNSGLPALPSCNFPGFCESSAL